MGAQSNGAANKKKKEKNRDFSTGKILSSYASSIVVFFSVLNAKVFFCSSK